MKQLFIYIIAINFIATVYAQVPCTPPTTTLTNIRIGVDNPPLTDFNTYQSSSSANFTTQVISGVTYYIIQDLTVTDISSVDGEGNCIWIKGFYNVIIRCCYLHDAQSAAIKLTNCHNITIIENRMQDIVFGVLAEPDPDHPNNNAFKSWGIKITNNEIKNVWSVAARGHGVMFNTVTTPLTGDISEIQSVVNNNKFENVPFYSDPEDIINMFQSEGTS